ncbi:uracil-DNA glycosylase family protein [Lactobacillus selangorensis]|uniref:Uracil-DNA glycosylase family protein n=1 Tax=Lactobacillus selangorensis TaxID=81857 RepID=A0A0R2FLQ4_9LACO|nr:uracil-DNA glycosylase [Lactobacillus selangorensis]KRN29480.1 uracil-DNA glycosylase family protein [Lactobacillus selangorensis]KRN33990.1 uracil-DNA glycosylase family protein [Lactobacillus selangorensis]
MATILTPELIKKGEATVAHNPNTEGFLPGNGSLHPAFILVGEAPGETELTTHMPFSGRAGAELDKTLAKLGITRDQIYITSTFRSRPYKLVTKVHKKTGEKYEKKDNRPPTQKEMQSQAFIFDYELAHLDSDLILAVGNTALKRLLGPKYTVGKFHGKLIKQPILQWHPQKKAYLPSQRIYRIFPSFHPAAVFYNRKLQTALDADMQAFQQFVTLPGKESTDDKA